MDLGTPIRNKFLLFYKYPELPNYIHYREWEGEIERKFLLILSSPNNPSNIHGKIPVSINNESFQKPWQLGRCETQKYRKIWEI